MRNWLENATAIVFVSMLAGLAIAQRSVSKLVMPVPPESKFVVHVDLNAIKQTRLGSMLFSIAKQKALEELGKEGGEKAAMRRIQETLGMDPFEDIQSITLSATDFEHPEDTMLAMVRLKKSSGNLEGLALGLPEYEATEHEEHQIHSASPKDDKRVYGAIHGNGEQDRIVLLSPKLEAIKSVLDELDTASDRSRSGKAASNGALASIEVFEIPEGKLGKGPQAAVAKIVTSFAVDLTSKDDNFTATAIMTTENEKQAEQLQQMVSGFLAMIDLAQSMDSGDKNLKQIRDTLQGVETTIAEKNINVTLTLNSDKIAEAIAKETGIKFDFKASIELSKEEAKLAEERKKLERLKVELEESKREADAKLEEVKQQLEKIK